MINIYIDDSGTKELNSSNQPIYLLSGVLIDTSKHKSVEDKLSNLLKESKQKIHDVLCNALNNDSYTKDKSSKIAKLLSNFVCEEFEIHCADMVRGDEPYYILSNKDRIEIVNKGIDIIKDNELDRITVACRKSDYIEQNKHLGLKEIQDKMNKEMVETLISEIENYLEIKNKCAFIFADEGNYTIKNYLIPYMETNELKRVNSVLIESKSHEKILIQLADISAYTSNLRIRNSLELVGKRSKESYDKLNDLSDGCGND